MMRHRRPLHAALAGLLPLLAGSAASATVGEPRETDAPVLTYAETIPWKTRVAAGPQGFFAVWGDSRASLLNDGSAAGTSVFGSRLDTLGHVLDPTSIQVSLRGLDPVVAFGAGAYLVAYRCTQGMCTRRIDPSGGLLDAAPQVVAGPEHCSLNGGGDIALAFDGSGFVLAWRNRPFIHAMRLGPEGQSLGPAPLELDAIGDLDSDGAHAVGAGFAAGTYLIAWTGGNARAQRLDAQFQPLGDRIETGPMGLDRADVLAGPGGLLLQASLGLHTVGASGPLGPLQAAFGPEEHLVNDGDGYLSVYLEPTPGLPAPDVLARRRGPDGAPAGPATTLFASSPHDRLAAAGTSDSLLVLKAASNEARLVTSALSSVSAPLRYSLSANAQFAPVVERAPGQYLVAWVDHRQRPVTILAQRLGDDGAPLDAAPLVLPFDTSSWQPIEGHPPLVLSFDGSRHALVLGQQGLWIDPSGAVSGTFSLPDVCARGPLGLVADASGAVAICRSHLPSDRLSTLAISSTGDVGTPAVLAPLYLESPYLQVTLTRRGDTRLAVWQQGHTFTTRLLDAQGKPLGDERSFSSDLAIAQLAAATDGQGFMLVGHPSRVSFDQSSVPLMAWRLDAEGVPLGPPFELAPSHTLYHDPFVSFDGTNYVASYVAADGGDEPIYQARVIWFSPEGVVQGPPGGAPLAPSSPRSAPAPLASDGQGHTLATTVRWRDEPAYHTRRVQTVLLTDDLPGVTAGSGGSGHVDGGAAGAGGPGPAGAGASGGAGAGGGGAGSTSSSGQDTVSAADGGGCGCRTAAREPASGAAGAALVAVALGWRRSSRRSPRGHRTASADGVIR